MPELPEVETVTRFIRPSLEGKVIESLSLPEYKRALHGHSEKEANRLLRGRKIARVYRRAKYIVLYLDDDSVLAYHLRMTGQLLTSPPEAEHHKYITATLTLDDNTQVFFKDVRKFGRLYCLKGIDVLESKLGVEPLGSAFTEAWLSTELHKLNRMIKPLLLDQSFIAGLGNIYVDEALWRSEVHPCQKGSAIESEKVVLLHHAIQDVLSESISSNGTTFQSFYFGEQRSGTFKERLDVFGRAGEKCRRCGSEIVKIRVASRGTHFCPKCQKHSRVIF